MLTAAVDWFRDSSDDDRPNDKLTVAIAIPDYVRDLAVRKSEDSAKRTAQSAAKHVPNSTVLIISRLSDPGDAATRAPWQGACEAKAGGGNRPG